MKNIFLFIAILFGGNCFAQDLISRKNKLSGNVVEKYHTIIEADKEVKQGTYQAFHGNTLIANGTFVNNKKVGIWHFYSVNGAANEAFDYNKNVLLAETAEDSTTIFQYKLDGDYAKNNVATKPIRIGGRYFGYVPYLRMFKLPPDMKDISHYQFMAVLELLVSPGGRLADFKIHLKSNTYERVLNIDPNLLAEDDKIFIPATVNKQPVTSRIFVYCYINDFDDIDMVN